ncbi:MAG: ribosomal protein S18-alanine N-acetyltransferase [Actinomycetota bacterium]|nr:ribosomal protein S18-alanine N-acetyltransferase [Actinomycetota bacterium]MDK1016252.1 ribosomal protein S18-alanine N-acetyltransferase [Actinomycetota bacterium]MDK1026008.1 ribosomal protein S18-alanine N-acetyltransferase [Actinomycetota bacterium]MDK1037880.1 ribosomal protein S18-alanine N-acetyltransferase [Actinomycetota bacterium]MDK1096897.1 ribosomal protein S18-alanine N-acetyltransferase [Actinomycetota bacterium]
MTAIAIREMNRADIPGVAALEAEVFDQPWSPRVFFDELAMDNREYIVVTSGDSDTGDLGVIGYGGLLIVDDDAHITTLAVAPEERGRQIGKRLMLALVSRALTVGAKHLTLEVRMSNASAQSLYESFGFSPVGRRKNYYKNEDALVMWATDIDAQDYAERIAAIHASVEGGGA